MKEKTKAKLVCKELNTGVGMCEHTLDAIVSPGYYRIECSDVGADEGFPDELANTQLSAYLEVTTTNSPGDRLKERAIGQVLTVTDGSGTTNIYSRSRTKSGGVYVWNSWSGVGGKSAGDIMDGAITMDKLSVDVKETLVNTARFSTNAIEIAIWGTVTNTCSTVGYNQECTRYILRKNYGYTFSFITNYGDNTAYIGLSDTYGNWIFQSTGAEKVYKPDKDIEVILMCGSAVSGSVTITVVATSSFLMGEMLRTTGYLPMPISPNILVGKYIKFTNGVATKTGTYFNVYQYAVSYYVGRKVKVYLYAPDENGASIAFYNSNVISTDTYLIDASIQSRRGYRSLEFEVPTDAKLMVVTHRNDSGELEAPIVLMQSLIDKPIISQAEEDIMIHLGQMAMGIYVKYDDGSLVSTGTHWNYTRIDVKDLRDLVVTCGQLYDTVAAPIAFYSADGTYIKDSSIQGYNGTDIIFSATVPQNAAYAICCAATSLDVKTHSIGVVVPQYLETIKSNYNPFIGKPLYHHLNQETVSAIPAQSLYDIAYAKALGFSIIEANVHKCSDGVYVTKHGNNGKLGAGLVFAEGSGLSSDTLFSEVSSTELRTKVTYNTPLQKYAGHIPTLDEFCAECKKLNMMILLQVIDDNVLSIARKYFSDNEIIAYGIKSRGDFRGLVTTFQNIKEDTSIDEIMATCATFGRPYMYGGFWDTAMSASRIKEINKVLHENGYLSGAAYVSDKQLSNLSALGVDAFASMGDVNLFDVGNKHNILSITELTKVGDVFFNDDGGTMSSGSQLVLSDNTFESKFGKLLINLLYVGELIVHIGTKRIHLESDNTSSYVTFSYIVGQTSEILKIVAERETIVKDIRIITSLVI